MYERVISTIYSKTLASITDNTLPSLAGTHAVTIQVVNLWYPTPHLNSRYPGTGYLIPTSAGRENNPEGALGVLFDSDREQLGNGGGDTVPGTKFTVLLGGHLWDDLPLDQWPDAAQAADMAKRIVARHLGIPQHETDRAVASTKVCRSCIPQHYVGHWARMAQAKRELEDGFGGRLAVAGPSYQMPGVLGSIRAGYDLALWISGGYPKEYDPLLFPVGDTGLGRFAEERKWFVVKTDSLPLRYASS